MIQSKMMTVAEAAKALLRAMTERNSFPPGFASERDNLGTALAEHERVLEIASAAYARQGAELDKMVARHQAELKETKRNRDSRDPGLSMRRPNGRAMTVLRVVQEAMGKAGVLNYGEVAKRADLHVRTVRGVDETTTVETLRKIATGLDLELVIRIEPTKTAP